MSKLHVAPGPQSLSSMQASQGVWQKYPWPQASPHAHGSGIEPAKHDTPESGQSWVLGHMQKLSALGEQKPPGPQSESVRQSLGVRHVLVAALESESRQEHGAVPGQSESAAHSSYVHS